MMRLNVYSIGGGVQLMIFCACLFSLSAPNVVVVVIEGFSHPFQQTNVISSLKINHLQHHHFRHGIENRRRIETTTTTTTTSATATATATTTTTTKLMAVKKDDDSSDEQSLLSSSSNDLSSSSSPNNNEAGQLSKNSNNNNNKKSNKSIFKKIFQTIGNGVFYTSSIIITTLGIFFSLGIVLNVMGYGYEFRLHGENGNGIPGIHIDTIKQMRIDRQFDRVSLQYENESYNSLNSHKTPGIIKTAAAASSTPTSISTSVPTSTSASVPTPPILMPSTTTTAEATTTTTTTTTMVES